VPEPERRLAGVDADPEQLELEDRVDVAALGRDPALHAKPALAHAGVEVAVLTELVLEGRQLRRPQHVEPGRVDLLPVVSHVQHREAVEVDLRLLVGLGLRARAGGRRGQQKDGDERSRQYGRAPHAFSSFELRVT